MQLCGTESSAASKYAAGGGACGGGPAPALPRPAPPLGGVGQGLSCAPRPRLGGFFFFFFCSCENPERRCCCRAGERRRLSPHLPDSSRRPRWACSVGRAASALVVGSLGRWAREDPSAAEWRWSPLPMIDFSFQGI